MFTGRVTAKLAYWNVLLWSLNMPGGQLPFRLLLAFLLLIVGLAAAFTLWKHRAAGALFIPQRVVRYSPLTDLCCSWSVGNMPMQTEPRCELGLFSFCTGALARISQISESFILC